MTVPTAPETGPLVYSFDSPPSVDPAEWPAIVGGKGAGLAAMRAKGIPVPLGFTIPTSVGRRVADEGWFDDLDLAVRSATSDLEASIGRTLGGGDEPLLVSVRSGAPVSMPGMMDTVLNVGMSREAAIALGRWGRDDRFGWDTYLRFIEGFASIVLGAPEAEMTSLWAQARQSTPPGELRTDRLAEAVLRFRTDLAAHGYPIPDDPYEQVVAAIVAVFGSWDSPRAITYREREGVDASMGTAATVQAMVFGNLGSESGTGVVFTRDPSTGAAGLMGDFLVGGQGEDVVAGTHRTQPISELAARWPGIADQLSHLAVTLELDLDDVADIEFTVENGALWILQARVGKRSPQAALRLAVTMAEDPDFALDRAGAVARVADILAGPPVVSALDPDETDAVVLASGLAASPGLAAGLVCTDPDEAMRRAEDGERIILVRRETSPADVHGMSASQGLVTLVGGLVSHAAVVARSWGIPAVVGVTDLTIAEGGIATTTHEVGPYETITVDGDNGRILLGDHAGAGVEIEEMAILREWQATLAAGGTDRAGAGSNQETGSGGPRADGVVTAEHTVDAADCLRALALKGMATAEALAGLLGGDEAVVSDLLTALVAEGRAQDGPGGRLMLTPEGTAAVEAAYAAESVGAAPAIEPTLERFHALNSRFKEIVTSWQMRDDEGEQVMNDHDDAEYDASVLAALGDEVHLGILTIIDEIAATVPRLGGYGTRLTRAFDGVSQGDLELMAHPLRDSYHTVWFELHEELIRLSGRNRADETAAGRA